MMYNNKGILREVNIKRAESAWIGSEFYHRGTVNCCQGTCDCVKHVVNILNEAENNKSTCDQECGHGYRNKEKLRIKSVRNYRKSLPNESGSISHCKRKNRRALFKTLSVNSHIEATSTISHVEPKLTDIRFKL